MKLNVLERIVILQLLPEKGSYTTLKIIDDLKAKIGFSIEEYAEFEMKELDGGKVQWNRVKEGEGVEKEFANLEKELIAKGLKDLDEKGELEPRHMSLYEKFVK